MSHRVSVIIPNYNHAAYLRQRLDSVLDQTLKPFEIIILDDCSTDKSVEIIEAYISKHPQIKFIKNEVNSGSTFAQWNKGVAMAKGDLIWIAESDDAAEPIFLEMMLDCFYADSSIALAYCQSSKINSEGTLSGTWKSHTDEFDSELFRTDFKMDGINYIECFLIHKNTIPNASAVVFKKILFENTGGANSQLKNHGDWMVWLQLLCIGKITFVSMPLNNFRSHHESVIAKALSNKEDKTFKDWYGLVMRKHFLQFLKKHKIKLPTTLKQANNYYVSIDEGNLGLHYLTRGNYFLGWRLILKASLYPNVRLGVIKKAILSNLFL